MNKLILKERNDKHVIYYYMPNGEGTPGEVVYKFQDQAVSVVIRASNDQDGYFGRRAIGKIQRFVKSKNFPSKSLQAWY